MSKQVEWNITIRYYNEISSDWFQSIVGTSKDTSHLCHRITIQKPTWQVVDTYEWLLDQIGKRYETWSYIGNGVWAFLDEEDAKRFMLSWG